MLYTVYSVELVRVHVSEISSLFVQINYNGRMLHYLHNILNGRSCIMHGNNSRS